MSEPAGRAPCLIIGIGNPLRSDDGLGAAVVERLGDIVADSVELLILDGEPTRLVQAWSGRRLAVVVDAVRGGRPPGTVWRVELDHETSPVPSGPASSHGAGVAEAVALGRALERLPGRLVVYGVEAAVLAPGLGLSPPVVAALPELVASIAAEVGISLDTTSGSRRSGQHRSR